MKILLSLSILLGSSVLLAKDPFYFSGSTFTDPGPIKGSASQPPSVNLDEKGAAALCENAKQKYFERGEKICAQVDADLDKSAILWVDFKRYNTGPVCEVSLSEPVPLGVAKCVPR